MTTVVKNIEGFVHSPQDLIDYLERGARPAEKQGVGVEVEKLVVDSATGEAASYERIEALLRALEKDNGWQGVCEEGHLIALVGAHSSVTLEPGGQLELSGALCEDLHCSWLNFTHHIERIVKQAHPLGLTFLGLGVQPFSELKSIDWLPKSRYGVMGPYMLQQGTMGQRVMKQSAGLQVNFDFRDEVDCIVKLRLCQALSPVLYALFANSPVMEDRSTGYLSTRGQIWSNTDPDRTGLLPQLYREDACFATYVDYALDVPMYFIIRDGHLLNLTRERFTFRRYMSEGFAGYWPTLGDWDLHLSTLFPEVRLRPQIEIRSADSLPPALTLSLAALCKGLLYDDEAMAQAWELFRGQNDAEREVLYRQSWKLGLRTPMGKRSLREVALELLEISRCGLVRQGRENAQGQDESVFLDGIFEIAQSGVTLAERLLAQWKGSRQNKLEALKKHCGFSTENF